MADDRLSGLGAKVTAFIGSKFGDMLGNPDRIAKELAAGASALPPDVHASLIAVLEYRKAKSYRDAAITQLAFGIVGGVDVDLTKRQQSGRTVAQALGQLLQSHHIEANNDAFENVAKNTVELCRGNLAPFDDLLRWANAAPIELKEAAFNFLMASRVATSRPVLPMPTLDQGALTFVRVAALLDELLNTPSGGAYHQYSVAACLDAVIDEFGHGGPGGLRVQTKSINVSDAVAGTPADIQIMRANRVEEAIEVTANDWETKIFRAQQVMRNADLKRLLIIGSVAPGDLKKARELVPLESDLSVIDAQAFVSTLLAIMRKPARAAALQRLYQLLDRQLSEIERVNSFVELLSRYGFTSND